VGEKVEHVSVSIKMWYN